MLAPGPLRDAAGIHYQEYSVIGKLPLRDDPFRLGEGNEVSSWMEFLTVDKATPLAYADHPFFGKWPCVTENSYGKGHLIYVGTYPSEALMKTLVARAAGRLQLPGGALKYQFPVIVRSGVNDRNAKVHYIFSYSAEERDVTNYLGKATELLTGMSVAENGTVKLAPWGVAILEQE